MSEAINETEIRTVADWQPVRDLAVAAKTAAEDRIAEGDPDAVAALSAATREIERIDREIVHSRTLEKALEDVKKARAQREEKAEHARVLAQLEERKPDETARAELVAKLRYELELEEGAFLAMLQDTDTLLYRCAHLAAKAEGRQYAISRPWPPHARLAVLVDTARRKLYPDAPLTNDGRFFFGIPQTPKPPPRPVETTAAAVATTNAATTRRKRG